MEENPGLGVRGDPLEYAVDHRDFLSDHGWVSTESQEDFTIEHLTQAVRRYAAYQALPVINRISVEEGKDSEIGSYFPGPASKGHKSPIFSQASLAFVARHLILHSNDFTGREPTWREIAELCHVYTSLYDRFLDRSPNDPYAIVNFLLRTAYEQFPLQGSIRNLAARTLYLFDILPREMKGAIRSVDLHGIFLSRTSLAIRQFIQCGFMLYASSVSTPILTLWYFTRPEGRPSFLTEKDLQSFLDYVSTDYQQFRRTASFEEEGVESVKHAFNPLWQWPVVRPTIGGRNQYVVPIPRLFLERVTTGIYYDFLHPDIPEKERKGILDFLGDIFETYVGKLLEPYYGAAERLHAVRYGRNKETVDWILVEEDVAILLECKTKRLRKKTKVNAWREDVAQDLQLALVEAATQLHETAEAILGREMGLEPLHRITRLLPIVVLAEPVYLANSPMVRQLIHQELKDAGLDTFQFQVISVSELEFLLPWRSEKPISDLLAEKFENQDARTWDLTAFMIDKPDPGRGHQALDTVSEEFFHSITAQ